MPVCCPEMARGHAPIVCLFQGVFERVPTSMKYPTCFLPSTRRALLGEHSTFAASTLCTVSPLSCAWCSVQSPSDLLLQNFKRLSSHPLRIRQGWRTAAQACLTAGNTAVAKQLCHGGWAQLGSRLAVQEMYAASAAPVSRDSQHQLSGKLSPATTIMLQRPEDHPLHACRAACAAAAAVAEVFAHAVSLEGAAGAVTVTTGSAASYAFSLIAAAAGLPRLNVSNRSALQRRLLQLGCRRQQGPHNFISVQL